MASFSSMFSWENSAEKEMIFSFVRRGFKVSSKRGVILNWVFPVSLSMYLKIKSLSSKFISCSYNSEKLLFGKNSISFFCVVFGIR